eukprot:765270-Hanusia_phi.AAC.5
MICRDGAPAGSSANGVVDCEGYLTSLRGDEPQERTLIENPDNPSRALCGGRDLADRQQRAVRLGHLDQSRLARSQRDLVEGQQGLGSCEGHVAEVAGRGAGYGQEARGYPGIFPIANHNQQLDHRSFLWGEVQGLGHRELESPILLVPVCFPNLRRPSPDRHTRTGRSRAARLTSAQEVLGNSRTDDRVELAGFNAEAMDGIDGILDEHPQSQGVVSSGGLVR